MKTRIPIPVADRRALARALKLTRADQEFIEELLREDIEEEAGTKHMRGGGDLNDVTRTLSEFERMLRGARVGRPAHGATSME